MSKRPVAKRGRARTPNNQTTTDFCISDELGQVLKPCLPVRVNTHRFGGGRPRIPDRQCAEAMCYVLRSGCQWQALNQPRLCATATAQERFSEGVAAGVFLKRWPVGGEGFEEVHGIAWSWLSLAGAMSKAPLGGKKTGPNPTDRGQSGVQRSLLTEGQGIARGLVIAGAPRHDRTLGRATLDSSVVRRPDPTEDQPPGLCLDKGDDSDERPATLQEFGFTAPSRTRGEETQALVRQLGQRARRGVVERSHRWLNRWRRILVRWENKPAPYLAFLPFAGALIAFWAAGLVG